MAADHGAAYLFKPWDLAIARLGGVREAALVVQSQAEPAAEEIYTPTGYPRRGISPYGGTP